MQTAVAIAIVAKVFIFTTTDCPIAN